MWFPEPHPGPPLRKGREEECGDDRRACHAAGRNPSGSQSSFSTDSSRRSASANSGLSFFGAATESVEALETIATWSMGFWANASFMRQRGISRVF